MLRRLVEEGVPIDVLTGASGGALVGSYFAAKGLPGLDQAVAEGDCGALDAMVVASMVSGAVMDSYLTCALGERCLEHMGPVEFYPAATDVSGGSGVVAVRGPLGLGVRAASSTPPIFGSTITNKMRLSDGAFTNNLPVQALEIFGADLTFGINCYPPSRLPLSPYVPTCAQRFLSVVSPLNRLMTFTSAFNLLGAVAGKMKGTSPRSRTTPTPPSTFPTSSCRISCSPPPWCVAHRGTRKRAEGAVLHRRLEHAQDARQHEPGRFGRVGSGADRSPPRALTAKSEAFTVPHRHVQAWAGLAGCGRPGP